MAYAGRLAIIAGGIGGLGSAIADRLRELGADVALLYAPFDASRVEDTLNKVFGSANPDRVHCFECDITSESSVKQVFREIGNLNAFPSILINAAGYVSVQPLEETSAEEALKNFLPNLLGPFITSNEFFRLYQARASQVVQGKAPPGRVVSIASQAAHVALDGHGAYCASKAGLVGHTRSMASEWGPKGITANTVSPTVTWTPLAAKAWADETKREKHLAQIPTGRFSMPSEIAHAIEFLCRDESAMINGADLRVDGGFSISR
ncbi:hypothetical protein A1O1_05675 [Capronia coronata CBS 617.96]|uniref:3-oxoacyl-[acyl-carrier protein] reductase n=1 Tax=Capronia coronata CBS 617.96 TaxID=1182541 RepID=W9Y880_9EURO|nr:uncharacterized protein A1O1_05675 [Capronia coronata CBS 617.96]EXJ88743.1 hypothetical protein A1O1_05675 [Capronia coronata CBS 617.96]